MGFFFAEGGVRGQAGGWEVFCWGAGVFGEENFHRWLWTLFSGSKKGAVQNGAVQNGAPHYSLHLRGPGVAGDLE